MSDNDAAAGGGFNPPVEPGRLSSAEVVELNRSYADVMRLMADINTRNIDQFARVIEGTRIKWLVYVAGSASILDMLHVGWLAARFVFKF